MQVLITLNSTTKSINILPYVGIQSKQPPVDKWINLHFPKTVVYLEQSRKLSLNLLRVTC